MKKVSFSSLIGKEGVNPYVDPPLGTGHKLGKKGVVPVKVRLDGKPFRANLMPLGAKRTKAAPGRHHRLYLHGVMRKTIGKDTGDRVQVELTLDGETRVEPVPPALARALKRDSKARETWESLSPSRRKEVSRYLNHLKTPEALGRTLKKVLGYLRKPHLKPKKNDHVIVRSVSR